jgi:Zn ribbon nucleic-acid-binding protein
VCREEKCALDRLQKWRSVNPFAVQCLENGHFRKWRPPFQGKSTRNAFSRPDCNTADSLNLIG